MGPEDAWRTAEDKEKKAGRGRPRACLRNDSSVDLFNKYLLKTYHLPNTILSSREIEGTWRDWVLGAFVVSTGRETWKW